MTFSLRLKPLPLGGAVALLALSQFLGYGTIYYAYPMIMPGAVRALGQAPETAFSLLTVSLILAGLAGPYAGRLIDRIGPQKSMVLGSLSTGAIYITLSVSNSFCLVAVLIVALQIVSMLVLYNAAFPLLALYGPLRGKKGMIWLGLLGGISASVFWPLAAWLVEAYGWRLTFATFAMLHLFVALPLHVFMMHREIIGEAVAAIRAEQATTVLPNRRAFWLIASAFGLTAVVQTGLVAHILPLMQLRGLGAQSYALAALVGPSMMAIRLAELLFWSRAHPIFSALIASLCFPVSILCLIFLPDPRAAGLLFAVFYGAGHGLAITSGGTLPLRIFGVEGYGEILGRIGAVRATVGALGPMLLAYGLAQGRPNLALGVGLVLALASLIPLLILGRAAEVWRGKKAIVSP